VISRGESRSVRRRAAVFHQAPRTTTSSFVAGRAPGAEGQRIRRFRVDHQRAHIAGGTRKVSTARWGLAWMPPEIRERTGRSKPPAAGRLPKLNRTGTHQGRLHAHTKWSMERHDRGQWLQAARDRGYEYLVISDHAVSMHFLKGPENPCELPNRAADTARELSDARLSAFWPDEVNIRSDGIARLDDEFLGKVRRSHRPPSTMVARAGRGSPPADRRR